MQWCFHSWPDEASPIFSQSSKLSPNSIKLCEIYGMGADMRFQNLHMDRIEILMTESVKLDAKLSQKKVKSELATLETLTPHLIISQICTNLFEILSLCFDMSTWALHKFLDILSKIPRIYLHFSMLSDIWLSVCNVQCKCAV